MTTPADKQFLIEALCEDLIPLIMQEYHLTSLQALDLLYKSNTFSKIEDAQTGLYYQGAVYVFEFIKEEFPLINVM